jgi:hypothetical protein
MTFNTRLMGLKSSKINDDSNNPRFPENEWQRYDDFAKFKKDYLRYHNRTNYRRDKQNTLTLCRHRGIHPMKDMGNGVSIPDLNWDPFRDSIPRKNIITVYHKGDALTFADIHYFVLDDGRIYKAVGFSCFYDKMIIIPAGENK